VEVPPPGRLADTGPRFGLSLWGRKAFGKWLCDAKKKSEHVFDLRKVIKYVSPG